MPASVIPANEDNANAVTKQELVIVGSSTQLCPEGANDWIAQAFLSHIGLCWGHFAVNTCAVATHSHNQRELMDTEATSDDSRKRIGRCRRAANLHNCVPQAERRSLCSHPHS